jgi:hypothetical protein
MAGTAAKRFLRVLLALPLAAPLGGPSTSALTARAGGGRPPYERVVDARTVATVKPVRGL